MQTSQKCEDSQTMIIALLVSYKEGCLLSQLCKDYYEMAGEGIPWKELGYSSLMNFLQSMSRSIQIEYRNGAVYLKGIASNKSKHISKLINSQKTEKPMLGRRVFKPSHYYPTTAPFKVQIPAEVLSLIISIVNEHPDGVNKDYVLQKVQDCLPHINITMREMEEQLYRLSHKISLSTNKIFPVQKKLQISDSKLSMETAAGEEDLNNFSDGDDLDFVSHANNEFKEVNERSKSNISKSYNFYNCSDDTTHVNNSNYGNVENENNIENKHIEDLINSRVRFRLEKLIQNNPDGIWCADLPEKYLEEYKVPLNYTELGFSSVREYASKLPNIFRCVQIDDTGDFILYHSKAEMLSIHSKEKREAVNLTKLHQVYPIDNENEALPTVVTLSTCNQMIPECVVTIGESVGQLNVTELVCKEKPYIEVVVVEVFTPTFFWIQLRKKQKAFKSLMDDLHNFYETNCQDYIVPPVILEKGLNCACIYNNIWHRGIIKTVKPDFQVIVMFYDYGTLKTYKANEVYYLHRKFSNLPAQAIPCGLYNVRPYKSTKWSRNATHQFAVRTSCIPLVATVESQWINETDNSMLITLTDTLEEEDVHINDWLVEQNLAEHGKMGDKVDMLNLLLYVEENLLLSPKYCYHSDSDNSDAVNNENEKILDNVPLVSPKSTLEDYNLKFSSQHEFPGKFYMSENLQHQTEAKNKAPPGITRPSIPQNEPICNETENKVNISPENLLQLWNENLKLQIQIGSIFHMLFNKAMNISEKGDDSMKNENNSNRMDTASCLNANHNSVATNILKVNADNGNLLAINDVQKIENFSRDLLNENSDNHIGLLQHSFKQLDALYSSIATIEGNNLDRTSQLFLNKSATIGVPLECEKTPPKINASSLNPFANAVNNDLPNAFEKSVSSNIPIKETNPFKADLLKKLKRSQENCISSSNLHASNKIQEPAIKHDIAIFKENNTAVLNANFDESKNPFDCEQYYSTCQLSKIDNTDTNSKLYSTDYSQPNVTNNTGVVLNSLSTIDGVNDLYDITSHLDAENEDCFFSEDDDACKYTPSYLRIRSQEHEQKQEETVILKHQPPLTTTCTDLSCDDDCSTMSWLPINSFPFLGSTMQDNKCVDEGYSTRPSTSFMLNRLSPLTAMPEDADEKCNNMSLQSIKNKSTETTCNQSQLQDSKCPPLSIDKCLSYRVYIKLLEIPSRQIHIIHYKKKCWLFVEEFLPFTKIANIQSMMNVLRIRDICAPFVIVDKACCSIEFIESANSNTQKIKDIVDGVNNLCLIQVKSALKLLKKLKIVSSYDLNNLLVQNTFESGSIMHEFWIIICAFEKLKFSIESRGK